MCEETLEASGIFRRETKQSTALHENNMLQVLSSPRLTGPILPEAKTVGAKRHSTQTTISVR